MRKAAGKDVPIAGMTFYNPFLQQWSPTTVSPRPTVGIAEAQVSDALTKIYKKQSLKVADVGTAFGTLQAVLQPDDHVQGPSGRPGGGGRHLQVLVDVRPALRRAQHPRHQGRLHADRRQLPQKALGKAAGSREAAMRSR